jgi:hypothetical protein
VPGCKAAAGACPSCNFPAVVRGVGGRLPLAKLHTSPSLCLPHGAGGLPPGADGSRELPHVPVPGVTSNRRRLRTYSLIHRKLPQARTSSVLDCLPEVHLYSCTLSFRSRGIGEAALLACASSARDSRPHMHPLLARQLSILRFRWLCVLPIDACGAGAVGSRCVLARTSRPVRHQRRVGGK